METKYEIYTMQSIGYREWGITDEIVSGYIKESKPYQAWLLYKITLIQNEKKQMVAG